VTTAVKAIYEGGVFKPTEPVRLEDKTEVEVLIPTPAEANDSTGWKAWEHFAGLWKGAPQNSKIAEEHDKHLHD
jgi:predicted DNA-binding antitoxin AbrB/MazE fold protein